MNRQKAVVDRQIEEYIALIGRQLAEREWRFVAIPRYGGALDLDPWFNEGARATGAGPRRVRSIERLTSRTRAKERTARRSRCHRIPT